MSRAPIRHPPTSRPKPTVPGQERADHILDLGEFQNVDTLTLSEASLVINALVAKRRGDRKNVNETEYACTCSFSSLPPHHTALVLAVITWSEELCVRRKPGRALSMQS